MEFQNLSLDGVLVAGPAETACGRTREPDPANTGVGIRDLVQLRPDLPKEGYALRRPLLYSWLVLIWSDP